MIVGLLYSTFGTAESAVIPRKDWQVVDGRDPNRLVVKFHEESGLLAMDIREIVDTAELKVQPLFVQDMEWLTKRYQRLRSQGVEDLRTYAVITGDEIELDALAKLLVGQQQVEHVYRDFSPQDPPMDIPPTTPDFRPEQYDHQPAPIGFGFFDTVRWSRGGGTRIVNIEYSYDPSS